MYLALTDEQQALRDELRTYFTELVTDELAAELAVTEGGGPLAKQAVRRMAQDGWLGIGWPTEFGGQGRTKLEQYIFYDEAQRAGAPVPFLTINTVGPALQEFGTREQQRVLPAEDPGGRAVLLHRLHRTERRHRPRVPDHACRTRRRRPGHQRAEDLHVAGRPRRLRVAGLPHHAHGPRPGRCRQARGHLDGDRAHRRRRVLVHPDRHDGGRPHLRDLLRGRAGPGQQRGRWRGRAGPGLAHDRHPAQLRTRVAVLGRTARAQVRRRAPLGTADQAGRRAPGHRPGVGPGPPRDGPRQARGAAPDELQGRLGRHPGDHPGAGQLGHQGLRHRAVLRGLRAAARGDGQRRPAATGLGRDRPARDRWNAPTAGR